MNFPSRSQVQKVAKKHRRKLFFVNIKSKTITISKFILVNIVLTFIISVIAFDYVSTEYDTLQIKEKVLEDNITATVTSGRGIDGETIPFNIDFTNFKKVKLGNADFEYIDIDFRIIQNKFPDDSIKVILDGKSFDSLDHVSFRIEEKRESPTHKQLDLVLKDSNERVGFASLDINQNFSRSIESKVEVQAKSRFARFIHNITKKLIEIL